VAEKIHDTLGELYRSRSYERHKPDRGEPLDFDGSDLTGIGSLDVGTILTTDPTDEVADVNRRLRNLSKDEGLAITTPLSVTTTEVKIPSDRTV